MKQIEGGVTAPKGFQAAGAEAAVKYKDRKDMALVYSEAPCRVAGVFTSNLVKAAPVQWDRELVEHSDFVQAVVVNSGIANACTGKQGMDCCRAEAAWDPGQGCPRGLHRRHRYADAGGPDHGRYRKAGGGKKPFPGGGP